VALVDPESGTARGITIDEAVASTWSRITVSQDGRFAYYSAQTPSALQLAGDVWRIDLETGSMENVTRSELGEAVPILLTDDQMALIEYTPLSIEQSGNGRVMVVLDLGSGERQRLTPDGQTVTFLDATGSGDWIVYSAFPENRREERAIWFVPSDGSSPPQLLLEDGGFDPQLSGDDRHILVRRVGGPNDPTVLEWVAVPDTAPWLD
jgi:Tol biopolymer transport system component